VLLDPVLLEPVLLEPVLPLPVEPLELVPLLPCRSLDWEDVLPLVPLVPDVPVEVEPEPEAPDCEPDEPLPDEGVCEPLCEPLPLLPDCAAIIPMLARPNVIIAA